MARRTEDLGPLAKDPHWIPVATKPGTRIWTDDLLQLMASHQVELTRFEVSSAQGNAHALRIKKALGQIPICKYWFDLSDYERYDSGVRQQMSQNALEKRIV